MPVYDCGVPDCGECEKAFGHDRSAAIAAYKANLAGAVNPPCRVCGSKDKVAVYDRYKPQETICPECCQTAKHADGETGHCWEYERAERGNVCEKCGIREHDDDGGISDRERIYEGAVMPNDWDMEKPALALCERLGSSATFPHEILKLDGNSAGIIIDLGGVDYVLTMTRAPKQRQRPN